jgi:photosystem II stability/assembly factor-like uncharacterized protein
MKATTDDARRLRESNPVAADAFAGAATDSIGRATFEHITTSPPGPGPARSHAWGRRRLLAIGAVAAVTAGVLAVLLTGSPRLTHPVHTAWQPAHALPQGGAAAPPGGPAGTWRLAGYLVSRGWQEHTTGPEAGYLTCPTTTTCYVQGNTASSASGPADMNSLYVSTDGAASWSVLPVPSGITFTSALSCGSAVTCAAGALERGQPVFVTTADGGHSWTIVPLPAGDGQIFQLSCPAATTCRALAAPSASLPLGQEYYGGVRFLATTDGGRHFAASAVATGDSMQYVSCPTTSRCVAIGVHNRHLDTGQTSTESVVATSADGGATWRPGVLPRRLGLGPYPQVSCVDAGHCFMVGYGVHYRNWSGEIAVSADGGRTWTQRPLPAGVPDPMITHIACPTDTTCYAAGEDAIPQHFANGSSNGGSAMVVTTHDAGRSWSRVMLARPARVPRGLQIDAFMSVGNIQCPRLNVCVGLGVTDQGTKTTPVYTSRSTP